MTDMEDTAVADQIRVMRRDADTLSLCINIRRYGYCNVCTSKIDRLHGNAKRLAARHATLSMQPSVAEDFKCA